MASNNIEQKKRKNNAFRWDSLLIEQLINSLYSYKTRMTFKDLDFDTDKRKIYSVIIINTHINLLKSVFF